jgi:AcrR family transcriptional regulator
MATTQPAPPALRADAARNRERIVAAARKVFAERGLEASTAEIAERAGVGEATLYRRFPSKDDLVLAIVETQMDEVIGLAEQGVGDPDPARGLERFMTQIVERSTLDRGVSDAAKEQCMMSPSLDARRARVMDLTSELVKRAQAAGAIRDDINGVDLAILTHAAGATTELPFPGLRDDVWKRYLGIILDGMRAQGATKLRPGAPSRRVFDQPDR